MSFVEEHGTTPVNRLLEEGGRAHRKANVAQ
jgi:hypothetical protein